MGDAHIAVFTTGDLITAAVFAVLLLAAVAVASYLAGYLGGARTERTAAEHRAAADMDTTADMFGPRPTPSPLRRIK